MPDTVVVYGFAPCEVTPEHRKKLGYLALESLLERVDERFGDPEDATDPTEKMNEAANAFVDAVLDEYRTWTCHRVMKETVTVSEYIGR